MLKLCWSTGLGTSRGFGDARVLCAPHRRMLQAGRHDSRPLARPFGRNRSLAGDRPISSTD